MVGLGSELLIDVTTDGRAHGMELTGKGAHGRGQQGEQKNYPEPLWQGACDKKRNDRVDIPARSGYGHFALGLEEPDIGKAAHYECYAGHHEDKNPSNNHGAVQLALAFYGHEPHDKLRLGQYSDPHA